MKTSSPVILYQIHKGIIDGYAVQSSPTGRRVGSTTIIHGDPGADEVDNEPDLTEDQDDDVLDEEDVQGRVYLPLVNQ